MVDREEEEEEVFCKVCGVLDDEDIFESLNNNFQPFSTKFVNIPSLALFIGEANLGDLNAAYSAFTTFVVEMLKNE